MTGPTIQIEAIDYALPKNTLTNDALRCQYPEWDFDHLEERTGVLSRHIAGPEETALDLALDACRKLENRGIELATSLDAIIFCTETPDYQIPPNSNILHGLLGMGRNVTAFDITAGCSGYVYGLQLAHGLIAGGSCRRVLLITGDTYSRLINAGDRSARCLFGDGAAASLIGRAAPGEGMLDCVLGTSGKEYERFMVPAGGARQPRCPETLLEVEDQSGNMRSPENIVMDGFGVLSFFNSVIPGEVRGIMTQNHLTVDDIDLFVFHQASAVALDALQRALKIPDHKMARELETTGNLVSASLPVTLKKCADSETVQAGSLVLLCGFGVGLSWGTALFWLPKETI